MGIDGFLIACLPEVVNTLASEEIQYIKTVTQHYNVTISHQFRPQEFCNEVNYLLL